MVDGGNDVTLTTSGQLAGTVAVGATTKAAGDVSVTVNSAQTADLTTGATAVTGGDTITVSLVAAPTVNTTTTFGAVTATGDVQTTSVDSVANRRSSSCCHSGRHRKRWCDSYRWQPRDSD